MESTIATAYIEFASKGFNRVQEQLRTLQEQASKSLSLNLSAPVETLAKLLEPAQQAIKNLPTSHAIELIPKFPQTIALPAPVVVSALVKVDENNFYREVEKAKPKAIVLKAKAVFDAVAPKALNLKDAVVSSPLLQQASKFVGTIKDGFGKITDVPVLKQLKSVLGAANKKYDSFLTNRYGPTQAKAIKASGVVADVATMAIGKPVPGMSVLGSLPALGIAEAAKQFKNFKNSVAGQKLGLIFTNNLDKVTAKAKSYLASMKDKTFTYKAVFNAEVNKKIQETGQTAQRSFGVATAAIAGFVRMAGPRDFDDLAFSLARISIQIGRFFLPLVRELTGALNSAANWIRNLSDGTRESVLHWTKFGLAALLAVTALGKVVSMGSGLISVFGGVSSAMSVLSGTSTVGSVLAQGFLLARSGASALLSSLTALPGLLSSLPGLLSGFASSAAAFVSGGFSISGAISGISAAFGVLMATPIGWILGAVAALGALGAVFAMSEEGASTFAPLMNSLRAVFASLMEALQPLWECFANLAREIFPLLVSCITPIIEVFGAIIEALKPVFELFRSLAEMVFPALAAILKPIVAVLKFFAEVLKTIFSVIGGLVSIITSPFRSLASLFSSATTNAREMNAQFERMASHLEALQNGGRLTQRAFEQIFQGSREGAEFLRQYSNAQDEQTRRRLVNAERERQQRQGEQYRREVGGMNAEQIRTSATAALQGQQGQGFWTNWSRAENRRDALRRQGISTEAIDRAERASGVSLRGHTISAEDMEKFVKALENPLNGTEAALQALTTLERQGLQADRPGQRPNDPNRFRGNVVAPKMDFSGLLDVWKRLQTQTTGESLQDRLAREQLQESQNQTTILNQIAGNTSVAGMGQSAAAAAVAGFTGP